MFGQVHSCMFSVLTSIYRYEIAKSFSICIFRDAGDENYKINMIDKIAVAMTRSSSRALMDYYERRLH